MSTRHPRVLPRGVFLICGDCVWAEIPACLQVGPCTLGKLTILTPNTTMIHEWWNKETNQTRKKRQLENWKDDCDSQITDWSRQKQVLMSIFLPWVAAAKALGELSHLEIWLGKFNKPILHLQSLMTSLKMRKPPERQLFKIGLL